LLVMKVEPQGPAEQAGIMLGDILVALAGHPIGDLDDLQAQLSGNRIGASVPATVVRGGKRQELTVTIGERR
jgi:S1-C subfamily serine protease